jgi:hypothetical protein
LNALIILIVGGTCFIFKVKNSHVPVAKGTQQTKIFTAQADDARRSAVCVIKILALGKREERQRCASP